MRPTLTRLDDGTPGFTVPSLSPRRRFRAAGHRRTSTAVIRPEMAMGMEVLMAVVVQQAADVSMDTDICRPHRRAYRHQEQQEPTVLKA